MQYNELQRLRECGCVKWLCAALSNLLPPELLNASVSLPVLWWDGGLLSRVHSRGQRGLVWQDALLCLLWTPWNTIIDNLVQSCEEKSGTQNPFVRGNVLWTSVDHKHTAHANCLLAQSTSTLLFCLMLSVAWNGHIHPSVKATIMLKLHCQYLLL